MSDEIKALRLSVSKSKVFADCKKKYHFSYILKLPRQDKDYHIFGKFIHQVLEDFHLAYINNSTDEFHKTMSFVYKKAMVEYKDKMTAEAKAEAFAIIDKYLQRIANNKEEVKTVLSVEKNFDFNISENVVINGMIDRIQLDPDGIYHIIDYKTSKDKKYLKNDFFQLLTYAYVIFNEIPNLEKIRGSYMMVKHNFDYITKEFTKQEILDIKERFEEYAKDIQEEKLWRPNPNFLCKACEYLDKCDEGSSFVSNVVNRNKNGAINW